MMDQASKKHIELEINDKIATVWMNRPKARNALNPELMEELIRVFLELDQQQEISAILLRGRGQSFCAGADLKWIQESSTGDYEKNYEDSKLLSDCFRSIYESEKIVISLVHGHSFGGGLGLSSACDFSFALDDTKFGLPELRLGVFSAVITPYLLTRVGLPDLKMKIFTSDPFDAAEAMRIGLIDQIFDSIPEMETYVEELLEKALSNSQAALIEGKKLLRSYYTHLLNEENIEKSIVLLAKLKTSDEARKRIADFLDYNVKK